MGETQEPDGTKSPARQTEQQRSTWEHPLLAGLLGAIIGAVIGSVVTFVLVSWHENVMQSRQQAYEEQLAAPDLTILCDSAKRKKSDWPPNNTVLIEPDPSQQPAPLGLFLSPEFQDLVSRNHYHPKTLLINVGLTIPDDLPGRFYQCSLRNDSDQAAKTLSIELSPTVLATTHYSMMLFSKNNSTPIQVDLGFVGPHSTVTFAIMKPDKPPVFPLYKGPPIVGETVTLVMPTSATYQDKVDPAPTSHPISAPRELRFDEGNP